MKNRSNSSHTFIAAVTNYTCPVCEETVCNLCTGKIDNVHHCLPCYVMESILPGFPILCQTEPWLGIMWGRVAIQQRARTSMILLEWWRGRKLGNKALIPREGNVSMVPQWCEYYLCPWHTVLMCAAPTLASALVNRDVRYPLLDTSNLYQWCQWLYIHGSDSCIRLW